jgi:hypothetical protein
MRQVTLVALYGHKSADLTEMVATYQEQIAVKLGDKQIVDKLDKNFKPYHMAQIHATIIGLEGRIGSPSQNLNFSKHRNTQKRMDFDGLLTLLRTGSFLPFQIQIGGFQDREYPFVSRGQRPYDRSFSIQNDMAVLMGWPLRGQPLTNKNESNSIQESRIYPLALDDLRRAGQNFNILHAWHRTVADVDNDFYFRIGIIKKAPLDPSVKQDLENKIRQSLSEKALIIEVTLEDLYVASYEDETLPLRSTKLWSISDKKVTGEFIESLYE